MSLPKYAIHFHKVVGHEDGEPVLGYRFLDRVAQEVGVRPYQIQEAFNQWGELGYPQEHLYFIEKRNGAKKSYRVYLRIWNLQGQNQDINSGGTISLMREHGTKLRQIPDQWTSYTLVVLA